MNEALREKEKGNQYFKAGKFKESIVCYSKAIFVCDMQEVKQLSVFYSNRAFAKSKQQRYLSAIDDATQSFMLDNKYCKPLYHRYTARLALGHLNEALVDITAVCILEKQMVKEHVAARNELLLDLSAMKTKEFTRELPKVRVNDSAIKQCFKQFKNHALFDESYDAEKIAA
ncbi:hypothetical protein B4U80_12061, partial [Leptotrombidium deliense]